MNAKLDAIIYAIDAADNHLIGLERKTGAEASRLQAKIEEAMVDADS